MIVADSNGKGFKFANGVYEYVQGKGRRGFYIGLSDIERTNFKDGEYKLRVSENIRRKIVFYVHDPNKEGCQWVTDLLFTLEAMRFSSPAEINVVFPYMKFARQERKDESRVSVSVKAIADVVTMYADRGMTIDLHAPQIREYFKIPFDNLGSFPVLIGYLRKEHKSLLENLVIVSPDAGGAKRAGALQKRLASGGVDADMAICYKKKEKDGVVNEINVMGEVRGKDCLIVDDIIDTGGTLVACGRALKEEKYGARKIFAYGTHGLFTEGIEKFRDFDRVIASDSVRNGNWEGLETVSVVDLFGEAIYRTIVGESLSSLFD